MKKQFYHLIYLLIATAIAVSCSKSEDEIQQPDETKETYEVSFRVKSFTQQMFPIASNLPLDGLSGLDESIYKIKYLIFDYRGNNVETIIQLNTDPDFGSHSLKLAEGDYKIVIWATSGDVRDGSDLKANYDHAVLHAAEYPAGSSPVIIHDSFYKEYDFSVSGTDVSNEIVLERETAKLELQILGGGEFQVMRPRLNYRTPRIR